MLGVTHALKPFLAILLILSTIAFTSASMPRTRTRKIKQAGIDEAKLLTNSARFQAGLGPIKPRSLYSPTRVRGIQSASPSPSARFATRVIEVRSVDNIPIGFVSNKLSQKGSFGLTQNGQEKLSVTFLPSSAAPFSLAIKGTKHPFLGFDGENIASPDTSDRSYLVETERTPPGSKPQAIGSSSNDRSASSIWNYNRNTHQLTAQWTNANGESPSTLFWYYADDLTLGLVDSTSSNSSLGHEVLLYLA